MTKFKAFPNWKHLKMTNEMLLENIVENIVGKRETAGYQHCLLFPQCFQKALSMGASNVIIVWQRTKQISITIRHTCEQTVVPKHHLRVCINVCRKIVSSDVTALVNNSINKNTLFIFILCKSRLFFFYAFFSSFTIKSRVLMTLKEKAFKNSVGKGFFSSFSHNVFYHHKDRNPQFGHIKLVFFKSFQFCSIHNFVIWYGV